MIKKKMLVFLFLSFILQKIQYENISPADSKPSATTQVIGSYVLVFFYCGRSTSAVPIQYYAF